jgi:hypothetical protein
LVGETVSDFADQTHVEADEAVAQLNGRVLTVGNQKFNRLGLDRSLISHD